MSFPRLFRREPVSRKGIRERSAYSQSAELALPELPPVSREAARAALARLRARRANGATA
jgi:hypothetical protein